MPRLAAATSRIAASKALPDADLRSAMPTTLGRLSEKILF